MGLTEKVLRKLLQVDENGVEHGPLAKLHEIKQRHEAENAEYVRGAVELLKECGAFDYEGEEEAILSMAYDHEIKAHLGVLETLEYNKLQKPTAETDAIANKYTEELIRDYNVAVLNGYRGTQEAFLDNWFTERGMDDETNALRLAQARKQYLNEILERKGLVKEKEEKEAEEKNIVDAKNHKELEGDDYLIDDLDEDEDLELFVDDYDEDEDLEL